MRVRCLVLVALVVAAAAPASAQRLSINPYQGIGFGVPGAYGSVQGRDVRRRRRRARHGEEHRRGGREPARARAQQLSPPPRVDHLRGVRFIAQHLPSGPRAPVRELRSSGRRVVRQPLHDQRVRTKRLLRAECPVILTTYEVLAPSWSYDFPLDAANSHELVLDATRERKDLRGNCTCTTYSTAACPPAPGCVPTQAGGLGNLVGGGPDGSNVCSPDSSGGNDGNDGPGQDLDRDGVDASADVNDMTPMLVISWIRLAADDPRSRFGFCRAWRSSLSSSGAQSADPLCAVAMDRAPVSRSLRLWSCMSGSTAFPGTWSCSSRSVRPPV